jgi:ribosomal protein S18 acetylase RimI-like enzyme
MSAVVAEARERGCRRLWLVTTNDNTRAIRFYQRFGMVLAAVRVGAVDEARARLKPTIPRAGADDIPIRDELVFELSLT